eukprot:4285971-Karenia_brevis.AAC.1
MASVAVILVLSSLAGSPLLLSQHPKYLASSLRGTGVPSLKTTLEAPLNLIRSHLDLFNLSPYISPTSSIHLSRSFMAEGVEV